MSTQDHPKYAVYGVEAPPPECTLIDIVDATVAMYPEVRGLEGTNGTLTYSELRDTIEVEVSRLRSAGVGRGDRVGIRVPSGTVDLYVAILATLYAGAAYVPVDWDESDSRAQTVWEEADVAVVYGLSLSIDVRRHEPNTDHSRATLDDDAWIIFTSGTTGKPKGVAITHRSAAALVESERLLYLVDAPLGPQDRVMGGLSVAFDASCEEMWLAWRNGSTLVAAPRDLVRSGEELGQWIVDEKITAVSTVPTLAAMWDPDSLTAVRLLIFGGEACPLPLIEKLFVPGRELWNTYGPTETTVIVSGQLMTPEPPVRIGRPIVGWELAVVNEDGIPVNWGETGELVVGGIGLGRYLDEEKDRESYRALPALGWNRSYHTGDLVKAEPEGLIFAGRVDDQIKIGGRRLELGEVDGYLNDIPGVDAAAAAVRTTESGNDVLVGYLSGADPDAIDLQQARKLVAEKMPKGVVPLLCVLDELPMKTSGKVDRKALPWPLATQQDTGGLPERYAALGELWVEQLGPVSLTSDSNFFELGGGSVAVARLAARIRETHPGAEIGELYQNPFLGRMSHYLESLVSDSEERPMPKRIPRIGVLFQGFWVLFLYLINALRYVTGVLIVVWLLERFFDAGWVPGISGFPLLIAWLVLYSLPGKVMITALITRPLTFRMKAGRYRRGGWTHLRLWASQRTLTFMQLENLNGTPFAPMMHRLLGTKVGRNTSLSHSPSVTGLLTIEKGATVEFEADLEGYWIDGDTLIVDTITIGENVRVGARSIIQPGVRIAPGAEILPGTNVDRDIEGPETWSGSPMTYQGPAGETWPATTPSNTRETPVMGRLRSGLTYGGGLLVLRILQVAALVPGFMLVFPFVSHLEFYELVFPILIVWVPVFTILMVFTWLLGVVIVIRILSVFIRPGYFPQRSFTGFAVWLTHTLMQRTLISTYPIYASSFTPLWFRLLGARVGKDVEISTVETIPHLTWIRSGSFLADHALANSTRMCRGWLHVGTTVIGEGSFVGNSAIVGPDRDVSDGALMAVLSTAPYHPEAGSSWLGRHPMQITRQRVKGEDSLTYKPPFQRKVLRAGVELCRIIPAMISNWMDLLSVYILTSIYMYYWLGGETQLDSLMFASLWSWPVLVASGSLAALVALIAKWLLVGRFRERSVPLFSSLVWRGELADVFIESLAIPGFVRMSLGTPMLNLWHRCLGVKIGRSVWCETWWLPEFDLIRISDLASVNRGTVLQTHLFHDRVMSMEPVVLEDGATLGPNSFVLPGAVIGECTTVRTGSLVQRQEALPDNSEWAGNPVRYLGSTSSNAGRAETGQESLVMEGEDQ